MPKVSVIVPIYNVEKYIERCIRSLFEQTLDDVEYIFVNDCTPDNSIKIIEDVLEEYPKRITQVKIIHHSQNQGQAGARTTGMQVMTGVYMIHCDPDDWVEHNMYELMYNKAIETNADIVSCAFNVVLHSFIKYINIEPDKSPQASLLNLKFTSHLLNKLIKNSIIQQHQIYPFEGINSGEDLNVVMRAYYYAKKVINIKYPLYHYDKRNPMSITNSAPLQRINDYAIKNYSLLSDFFKVREGQKFEHIINFYKWRTKYELLERPHRNVEYWSKLWRECHKDINRFGLPLKQKIIFKLFSNYPKILKLYFKYLDWRIKA